MFNHGLNKKQLDIIKKNINQYVSNVTQVNLFGSRAIGNYKDYSDIDLVLYGDIDDKDCNKLWTIFYESALPYKVDIINYKNIVCIPMKRHIDTYSKILFKKETIK